MKKTILSLGTMYVDINCIDFPLGKGLFPNREVVGNSYQLDLGGSALNFSKNASSLGLDIHFIGKMGKDLMGDILISLLKQNKITPRVMRDRAVQTNVAIHYIHHDGSSIMSSCGNANQSLSIEDIEKALLPYLGSIDFLYLGGVFKLKSILPFLPKLAEKVKTHGAKVILDHGRINNSVTVKDIASIYNLFPYVDIYLPSNEEFLALWESKVLEEGMRNLRKISQPITIIKQSEVGATGFMADKVDTVKAYKVKSINTVGAGDSFNAGFIKAYINGMGFKESMKYACATAAIKISNVGTVDPEKVTKLFENDMGIFG